MMMSLKNGLAVRQAGKTGGRTAHQGHVHSFASGAGRYTLQEKKEKKKVVKNTERGGERRWFRSCTGRAGFSPDLASELPAAYIARNTRLQRVRHVRDRDLRVAAAGGVCLQAIASCACFPRLADPAYSVVGVRGLFRPSARVSSV